MYRIRFETSGGYWVIEIAQFEGLWWSRIKTHEPDFNKLVTGNKAMKFEDLAKAVQYVTRTGIDKVYRDRTGPHPATAYAIR